jgi:hypothetical protein
MITRFEMIGACGSGRRGKTEKRLRGTTGTLNFHFSFKSIIIKKNSGGCVMPGFKWVTHKGKRILSSDIASQKTEELLDIIEKLKKEIEKEPLGSVLSVCTVKGGKTNTEINKALKDFVQDVDPYMKMTAIIGMEGLQQIIFNSVIMFSRTKKLTSKNSEEEALDYLAGL